MRGSIKKQVICCSVLCWLAALTTGVGRAQSTQQSGGGAPPAASQDPAPAQAPAPAPAPAAPTWSAGPIDFSGLVDAYYNVNFNHPASRNNQLRNWDTNANQFSFAMAKLTASHDPDPVGFRLDIGLGPAFDIVNAGESGGLRYIEQAYVTWKPAKGKGLVLDFGKFVTQHGAEVIETHSNWNYSHSLLFAWAIPYYHFGFRATYPFSKTFTGAFYLVNGWNNVVDNNSGKTVGLQGVWNPNSHVSFVGNYMFGPEKTDTNKGYRHLFDATLTLTANSKAAVMFNYDYGVDKFAVGKGKARWTGIASYAKFSPTSWFAFIPRGEWYNDADGFTTGAAQKLKEVTMTAEFKMMEGLLTRLEYRHDWSDQKFFDRGNAPGSYKSLDTLAAGFIVFFGPKR